MGDSPAASTGKTVGVVLAAGGSTRMGHPKQLIEIDGESLVLRTARNALALPELAHVIVVLGAHAAEISPQLDSLPVIITETPAWTAGLAQSIRAAMDVIDRQFPATTAILFTICDQPHLNSAALHRIMAGASSSGTSVVAARYDNHPGTPCLINRDHFQFLRELQGDRGANALFTYLSPGELTLVDLPQLALDLDTPADLARWNQSRTDSG